MLSTLNNLLPVCIMNIKVEQQKVLFASIEKLMRSSITPSAVASICSLSTHAVTIYIRIFDEMKQWVFRECISATTESFARFICFLLHNSHAQQKEAFSDFVQMESPSPIASENGTARVEGKTPSSKKPTDDSHVLKFPQTQLQCFSN
jgi:hypothetical protein